MAKNLRRMAFGLLILAVAVGCNTEEKSLKYQGPLGSIKIDGSSVDTQVYDSLTAQRKALPKAQMCKSLEDSKTGRQLYFAEGSISRCEIQADWLKTCVEVGTYKSNRLTMSLEDGEFAQVYDFEVMRRDSRTLEFTKVFIDEVEIDLGSVFTNENELFIKQVSPGEVTKIHEIKATCGAN